MDERWRKIPGFPTYEVSDIGRVRSLPRVITRMHRGKLIQQPRAGKILKPGTSMDGYPMVVLCDHGRRLTRKVHLLVLIAFRGPRPGKLQGLHNDGKPANCRLENLRWGSAASNTADSVRHGTRFQPRGEEHGCAILTEEQVRIIRRAPAKNGNTTATAKRFGVSSMTIWSVRTGRTWKHLGENQ